MKILLAVSGGKDSMTMSDLALRAAKGEELDGFERFRGAVLGIAHCNFHLRPGDCDADAALVEEWAKKQGLPFHRADFQTQEYAAEKGISVEMAARELRYTYFARLCREFGYEAVAVAHQADDNAETLLLHLLRGCGLDGACAMTAESVLPVASSDASPAGASAGDADAAEQPARRGSAPTSARPLLLRPMLGYSREEINGYTIVRRVPFREDKSNAESIYQRNLLRNRVFPLLNKINPSAVETLCRDSENFRRSRQALDFYVRESWASVSLPDAHSARYDASRLPSAVLPEALFRLLSSYDFGSETVDAVLSLLKEGLTEGKCFYSDSSVLLVRGGVLRLREKGYASPQPMIETLAWQEEMPVKQPEGVTAVDAEALPKGWVVRRWREGDWMRPLGMQGRRKKLSDLFADLGYDAFDKADTWVLASSDAEFGHEHTAEERVHVWALLGRRIDNSVRIIPGKTRSVLRFTKY